MQEKNIKKVIQVELSATRLSKQEKDHLRSNIIAFMRENSMKAPHPNVPWRAYVGRKVFQFSVLAFVVFSFAGYTISNAAHYALPGELLYPVKTHINEKVLGAFLVSDKQKASYQINLVKVRLEEMEALAEQDGANDENIKKAQLLLADHMEDININIHDIETSENTALALELYSSLEAYLHAHSNILDEISKEQSHEDIKKYEDISSYIKLTTNDVAQKRQSNELSLPNSQQETLEKEAKIKIQEAQKYVDESSSLLNKSKDALSEHKLLENEDKLNEAKEYTLQAQSRLELGDYSSSLIFSQSSLRNIQEVTTYIQSKSALSGKGKSNENENGK